MANSAFDINMLSSLLNSLSVLRNNTSEMNNLEKAFDKIRLIDNASASSIAEIKFSEKQIIEHKKYLEDDKIKKAKATEELLVEVNKFNLEHPESQLDVSLEPRIMYSQYQFYKSKFNLNSSSSSTTTTTPANTDTTTTTATTTTDSTNTTTDTTTTNIATANTTSTATTTSTTETATLNEWRDVNTEPTCTN